MDKIDPRIWGAILGTGFGIILLTMGFWKLIVILALGITGYLLGNYFESREGIRQKLRDIFEVLTR